MEILTSILGPSVTDELHLTTTGRAVLLFEGGYALENPFFSQFMDQTPPSMSDMMAGGARCCQNPDGSVHFRLPDREAPSMREHLLVLTPWDWLNWPELQEMHDLLDWRMPGELAASLPDAEDRWARYQARVRRELQAGGTDLEDWEQEAIYYNAEAEREMPSNQRATLAQVVEAWAAAGKQLAER